MVASLASDAIPCVAMLAIPVALITSLVLWKCKGRRQEMIIRQWADRHGYSISDMRRGNVSIFATFMFWLCGLLLGWLLWWFVSRWGWRVTVYDEEGGQKSGWLYVYGDGRIEEHWS